MTEDQVRAAQSLGQGIHGDMRESLAKPNRKDVPRLVLRGTGKFIDGTKFHACVQKAIERRAAKVLAYSIGAAESAAREIDENQLEILDE